MEEKNTEELYKKRMQIVKWRFVTTCVSTGFDAFLKPITSLPPGSILLNITATKQRSYINGNSHQICYQKKNYIRFA